MHTRYWHFLNLNSISFNFCSYTFFRLKPRYWVLLNFCWNLGHCPQKLTKNIIFWQTNIHTYSILTFSKLKFNLFQLLFLHFFPIKASLRSFVEFLLNICWNMDHVFPKNWQVHNFLGKLTYIYTRYWHFLNLKSISNNFCSKKIMIKINFWGKNGPNFNKIQENSVTRL